MGGASEVDAAVAAARSAFPKWVRAPNMDHDMIGGDG